MKPIILSGHSRPIKDLKFSSNSDLLFSGSSDRSVILWASETGQKLMTYEHTAAVNTIGVTSDSKLLVTGDNTGISYIWDIHGGNLLKKMENADLLNLKALSISNDDRKVILIRSGRTKDSNSSVDMYNLLDIFMKESGTLTIQSFEPLFHYESDKGSKYVASKFSRNDKSLFLAKDNGLVELLEISSRKEILKSGQFHEGIITNFDMSANEDILLTASLDGTSKVVDFNNMNILKTFQPQEPTRNINTCKFMPGLGSDFDSLSKLNYHAVISGGQDSRNVTTTNAKEGGFDLEFLNILTGDIVGSVKGHFGPVNTLDISPNGKIIASGGEDSAIRLQRLDDLVFDKK